jgi:uncharacterized protein RhaS with RHS repeats
MYEAPHLYYVRARYYDPTIGRFLGGDAKWDTNLFSYSGNNPINNIDPNGKSWFGTTLSTLISKSTGNLNSFIGKYLIAFNYTHYWGVVDERNKGIVNVNTTINNGKTSIDLSRDRDIGKLSSSFGVGSSSIGYNGTSLNFIHSIGSGLGFGYSHINTYGDITGSEISVNPFKIIPVAGAAALYGASQLGSFAPVLEMAPILLFL